MAGNSNTARAGVWPGFAAIGLATCYLAALLAAEQQDVIIALLALGIVAVLAAAWFGLLGGINRSFTERDDAMGVFGIVALVALGAYFHEDHFILLLVVTVILYSVATLGLNIQFGYAGVLNFAGASFFGIGAYTSAVLNTYTAVPHLIVLLIGGLLAALIGSLLLLPVLRTRGHYAAVVTIAFALLFKTFLEVNDVLGGPQGMQVPPMTILGWSFNDNIEIGGITLSFYLNYFVVSLLLLDRRLRAGAAAGALLDRPQSRRAAAGRDGGELLRPRHRALEDHRLPDRQLPDRHRRRAVRHGRRLCRAQQLHLRRLAHPGVDPAARRHRQSLGSDRRDFHRRGGAGETADHPGIPLPALCGIGDRRAAVPARRPAAASGAPLFLGVAAMTALLEARGVVRRFGGVIALDGFDLTVAHDEILGLIGPNGSGKTTFFNVITGIYGADEGNVTFDGSDITRASSRAVYQAGIARTFQRSRLSLPLSIFDNIMIGNHKRLNQGLWFNLVKRVDFKREFEESYRAARALVEVFEPKLADRMFEPAAGLPMIDRRRIEICRALISAPKLLLLDEPSAGMTHDETAELMNDIMLVRERNKNLTIIIVEHEMGVIERITDRCVVLNFGRKLAEGPYREVAGDAQVQEAYLGSAG